MNIEILKKQYPSEIHDQSRIENFYFLYCIFIVGFTLNSFKFLKLLLSTPALPGSQSPLKKPLHFKFFLLLILLK